MRITFLFDLLFQEDHRGSWRLFWVGGGGGGNQAKHRSAAQYRQLSSSATSVSFFDWLQFCIRTGVPYRFRPGIQSRKRSYPGGGQRRARERAIIIGVLFVVRKWHNGENVPSLSTADESNVLLCPLPGTPS
uniref:Uncharacterized protein n=1 Tax=Anopheles funestus TaxID=62324 RepID=A0A182RY15_ANOFN